MGVSDDVRQGLGVGCIGLICLVFAWSAAAKGIDGPVVEVVRTVGVLAVILALAYLAYGFLRKR